VKFLFLFCSDPAIDPVAPAILHQVKDHYAVTTTSLIVGGKAVFHSQVDGHQLFFAETRHVASALYPEIAEELNSQFSDVDMIGLVNWHAGANSPTKIFCAHSTADVPSGIFGATRGELLAATLMAIEAERDSANLIDFRTLFEASHWSGLMYGRPAAELLQVKAPVFDIEIGSSHDAWSNASAQGVLVRAFGRISEFASATKPGAIYLGGIHFEPSAAEIIFQSGAVIEHHLPNQWLVSGEYNLPGAETKLVAAAKSCLHTPKLIVYNAGLKSAYKESARQAAALLRVPCVSHKQLRAPDWKQTILSVQT
jgi:D-tyrosyl-tRNA(Tyr) deacylase